MRKIHYFYITALLFLLAGFGLVPEGYEFEVKSTNGQPITLDGEKTETAWVVAGVSQTFVNPWDKRCAETVFSMVHDKQFLYFFFDAKDDEIVSVADFTTERDAEREDRVELYLSKDPDMKEYYCFEIDAMGRVLSYKAQYHRNFDFSWEPPEGFHVATQIHADGYTVEGGVPLTFLKDFIDDGCIYFGAYRADFSRQDDSLIKNWLTWKDPKTAQPDYHVPASLGKLIFK